MAKEFSIPTPSVSMSEPHSPDFNLIGGAARRSVLVFIKEPVPGRVKTRLAAAIGASEAASLYEQWTTSILVGLQSLRESTTLIGYYAGDENAVRTRWERFADRWLPQPEGDLGERLTYAFTYPGCNKPSIAVGTDCLDVDSQVVRNAFSALETSDAVLGPATDGGYYLIGLNREATNAFAGVEWSSPQTCLQQKTALQRAGLRVSELTPLSDIDTLDDWNAYLNRREQ
jgi:rSAM/selenodomain-associated transferase 1